MAASRCPHCKGTAFEAALVEPRGARFKYYFIQCAGCGAPVSTVEFNNIGASIGALEDRLNVLAA
jgi:hypothetical protein